MFVVTIYPFPIEESFLLQSLYQLYYSIAATLRIFYGFLSFMRDDKTQQLFFRYIQNWRKTFCVKYRQGYSLMASTVVPSE